MSIDETENWYLHYWLFYFFILVLYIVNYYYCFYQIQTKNTNWVSYEMVNYYITTWYKNSVLSVHYTSLWIALLNCQFANFLNLTYQTWSVRDKVCDNVWYLNVNRIVCNLIGRSKVLISGKQCCLIFH